MIKDLEELAKFCKKHGVEYVKTQAYELKFGPPAPPKRRKKRGEKDDVQVESELTEEEILMYSVQGAE